GVNSERLAQEIARYQEIKYLPDREELLADLRREAVAGDLLLTLGAGDVWEIGEAFLEQAK
ncbi:UDP-N-acetylmuramate--L-alanine ligase, partial [Acidobacteria bacterium AH-259-O06]|nr:UDP-N-acetylmuramate--L-alanine ligase [Acidobacteria bacterium AH-259-O06]